jgi:hypothetical protein
LDKITISDGITIIEMPRVKNVAVGGEEVAVEVQMASGKLVKEMIGTRIVVTAEWDWLPADTVNALHTLLRQGGFFTVSYPDPSAGDVMALFSISYPTSRIFRFIGTTPCWHDVKLTMRAQEVV